MNNFINYIVFILLSTGIIACSNNKFIPVEKNPQVDIVRLSSLVKYPDLARRSGTEGKVIVKVLVGKNGEVLKSVIEYSDSRLLENAALNAVKAYGDFEPAEQGGKKVACWLSVPITFKLRPLVENKENE